HTLCTTDTCWHCVSKVNKFNSTFKLFIILMNTIMSSETSPHKKSWRESKQQIKEWKKHRASKKEAKRLKQECELIQNNGEEVGDNDQPKGREWTLSIAIPASIVDNAQSPELKTYLCGQIARAAVVFNVDEVVVFDERVRQMPPSVIIAN